MVTRSLLFVLSLYLQHTSDAARVCTPSKDPGMFTGPLNRRETNSTEATCQAICANDDSCVAYMLDVTKSHSWYVTLPIIQAGSPVHMETIQHSGRCGTNLPTINGDLPGNDLSNVPSPDAVQCSYRCEETKACNAFSWTTYNGGTCWMKTAKSELKGPYDGSVVSGEVFRCQVYLKDRDIVGEDFASVPTTDWRDCCQVCRTTQGCEYATWSNYNGGTCWLKKSIKYVQTTSGVISMGIK